MDTATQNATATTVYVACARTNEIVVFSMRPADGSLELIQRLSVPTGITPLAVRPDRRFLYAGLRGAAPAVMCLATDAATGELAPRGSTALIEPPMYLATDRSGEFLFSASYAGATFTISAIGNGGDVDPAPVQHTATPPKTHGILPDRTNRFLFVTVLGSDAILQYDFDPETGHATPNAVPFVSTPPGSGPRHLAWHPTRDVLYVNGELDGSVCSYAMSPDTGQLQPLHRERILPASNDVTPWGAELALTPEGHYLYASERRTSVLASFDLRGEPGTLARLDAVRTEEQPRSFAIDSRGRWLVLAGEQSNHLCVYAIDASSGGLEPRHRYPVGDKPAWVTIVDL